MWRVYAYGLLFFSCCAYAALRGGGPERTVLGIVAFGSVMSPLAAPLGTSYHTVPLRLFAVDMIDQLALVFVALRANRFWPLAAAGIHWLSPMSTVAKAMLPSVQPIVYFLTEQASFFLVLILMAIGTWRHRSRLAQFGSDPSWSSYSRQ